MHKKYVFFDEFGGTCSYEGCQFYDRPHMYIFLQTIDQDASFKLYFIDVRPLFIAEMPFEAQTS